MKNPGCKIMCAVWFQVCLKSSQNGHVGNTWKEIHQNINSYFFQVRTLWGIVFHFSPISKFYLVSTYCLWNEKVRSSLQLEVTLSTGQDVILTEWKLLQKSYHPPPIVWLMQHHLVFQPINRKFRFQGAGAILKASIILSLQTSEGGAVIILIPQIRKLRLRNTSDSFSIT